MALQDGVPAGYDPDGARIYVGRHDIEAFLKWWAENPQDEGILLMNAPPGFGKTYVVAHWYKAFFDAYEMYKRTRAARRPAHKPDYLVVSIGRVDDYIVRIIQNETRLLDVDHDAAVAWLEWLYHEVEAFYGIRLPAIIKGMDARAIVANMMDALTGLRQQPGLALLVLVDGIDELGYTKADPGEPVDIDHLQRLFSQALLQPFARAFKGNPAARRKARILITSREETPQLDGTSKGTCIKWSCAQGPLNPRPFTPQPLDPWEQFCRMQEGMNEYRHWDAAVAEPGFRAFFDLWKAALAPYAWDIPLVNHFLFAAGLAPGIEPDPARAGLLKPVTPEEIRAGLKLMLERRSSHDQPLYPELTDDVFEILLRIAPHDRVDIDLLERILGPQRWAGSTSNHPFVRNGSVWGIWRSKETEEPDWAEYELNPSVRALLLAYLRLCGAPQP